MIRALTLAEAVSSGVGIEREFLCPVHGDTRPSASVNMILGVWYCYTCKATGRVGGDAMLGEIDFAMVHEYVDAVLSDPTIYAESWLNQYDAGGPGEYWLSRFTPKACEWFRLGEDLNGRPIYPLRDHLGQVLGVVTRSGMEHGPKYLYPKGLDIGQYLFNYSMSMQEPLLVLVEGAADAIAVWEAGFHAVALYGSKLSQRQYELIQCVDPIRIVTAFDQDAAGEGAARQVAKRFPEAIVGRWYPQLGDIADMNLVTRKKILEGLVYGQPNGLGSLSCESPTTREILSPGLRPPSQP